MEKRTKESSKRINSLILLIAFTAIMLIVSTYAWFTSQKDVTLSNLRGTVEVVENMEISLDAKEWSNFIDLTDAQAKFDSAQTSRGLAKLDNGSDLTVKTVPGIIPKELLPVSGYGKTGEAVMPLWTGTAEGTKLATSLTGITQTIESKDGAGADAGKLLAIDNGYIATMLKMV